MAFKITLKEAQITAAALVAGLGEYYLSYKSGGRVSNDEWAQVGIAVLATFVTTSGGGKVLDSTDILRQAVAAVQAFKIVESHAAIQDSALIPATTPEAAPDQLVFEDGTSQELPEVPISSAVLASAYVD